MFDKNQLEIIKKIGKEGLSLRNAASSLKMNYSKFMEEYEESEEAQLAYETGQSELEIEVVTVAKAKLLQGDKDSFNFLANTVLNMDGKNSSKTVQQKTKKVAIPKILLNPNAILEIDDDELKRLADNKEADRKAKEVNNVDVTNEDIENTENNDK